MKKIILIALLILIAVTAQAQTFPLPEHMSPYDIAEWVSLSGFIASGTVDPTSIAENGQLYTNTATPTAPILWMSWNGVWSKITSSFAPGTVSHADLVDLDYASSGHTGFAASTDIPNNASFTLSLLGEKEFASLDGKPTNASYTLALLSEHSFNSLTDKPTSADYTLAGLGEHSFNSLDDKPTSADYTLLGLGEKLWSSLDGAPTNASYTLALLSEHSYNSLTDKPTSASWTLAGLSERNFTSLLNRPTTLAGYGITDAADATTLTNHIAETVNPHGEDMTLGTGDGIGAIGYLASDTIFIERYFYIPFQAIATTLGINSSGMTFWADDNTKGMKIYNGTEWLEVHASARTGVFAYLTTSTATTCTTAGTYYPIAGAFTNMSENFTPNATPEIVYDGLITKYFEIDWHATVKSSSANTTLVCSVKKNGTETGGAPMGQFLKNANQPYALSGTVVVELATNDAVQLVVKSDIGASTVTFDYYTTTIRPFFY